MEKALYKIENLINHKIYIGQSIHPERRWAEHCSHANCQTDDLPIHNAIAKYGKDNFSFTILEWSQDYNQHEQDLIKRYNALVSNGYNVLLGGQLAPILVGENHPRNTITDATVHAIIKDLQLNELSDVAIADKYSTTAKIVADINHGVTHRQSNLDYPLRTRRGRTGGLPLATKMAIIADLQYTTLSYSQLAKKYSVSKGLIGHINYGRYETLPNINYPIRRRKTNENQGIN